MTIEAMRQALTVLEEIADEVFSPYDNKLGDAITALRAAIDQAEKPRQWQGLTDDELFAIWMKSPAETEDRFAFVKTVMERLKEKNT